jgi:HPt (histidine-containing phosphotransfer) domain-containing protein
VSDPTANDATSDDPTSHDPTPYDLAAVDTVVLDGLCRDLGDDRDAVRSVVRTYLDQLDHRRRVLAEAVVARDAPGVHAAAHALRSTSVTLGVHVLAEPAHSLELNAGRGDMSSAQALLERIDRAVPAVRTCLEAW